jgi:ribonuclease E
MLVVNARDPEEVRIALLDQGKICDLRSGRPDAGSMVGNVYLGVVKQVEDSLDAAFVDFGDRRAGFLHVGNVHPAYQDASVDAMTAATTVIEREVPMSGEDPEAAVDADADVDSDTDVGHDADVDADSSLEAETAAPARISDLLEVGRAVVVQVVRDPVRGKGATLSTIISLAGFGLVWMPSLGRIGVSRRIEETEERERLREVLTDLGAGEGLPVIARTAAAGEPKRVLQADMTRIQKRIKSMTKTASAAQPPVMLVEEETIVMRAIRELFHAGIESICCDEQESFKAIAEFLERKGASNRVDLRLYEDEVPLFEQLALETDYQRLFRSRVPIGRGASIVIHPTEALTAVDVNSGRIEGTTLEETALQTNLLAVEEVANQVRLRDLGGIIVVDFIDMREPENRRQVEEAMREALRGDRARMKTGRIGSFGLFSFTRRRLGTGPGRAADAMCRSCGGSGNYAHHSAGALRVLRRLRALSGAWMVRIRAQEGVVHQLRRHQIALQGLPHKVEFVEDPQVPSGESVLEPMTALADASDPR